MPENHLVDVVIIAAMEDELKELRKIASSSPGEKWSNHTDASGYPYFRRSFEHEAGGLLSVVAASASGQGEAAATAVAGRLIHEFHPRCLAMSGICAGRRGKVFLGDVIVASKVFKYDGGKLIARRDAGGHRVEEVLQEIDAYSLDPRWRKYLELCPKAWSEEIARDRPLSCDYQLRWLLYRLADGEDPRSHPGRRAHCPDFTETVDRGRSLKFLSKKGLRLIGKGRDHVADLRVRYPDGLEPDPEFKIRLGDLGSGTRVIADEEIFETLKRQNRTTLGLEMEAHAIGFIAEIERLHHVIVIKGVQDYADEGKNDHFRRFAARASADLLIRFLRRHLPMPAERIVVDGTSHRSKILGRPAPGRPYHEAFYVARKQEEGEVVYALKGLRPALVWGPKGIGKTWFLHAVRSQLLALEWQVYLFPIDLVEKRFKRSLLDFLQCLSRRLVDLVGGDWERAETLWAQAESIGETRAFDEVLEHHVLPRVVEVLVLVMDRIDDVLRYDFSDGFFVTLKHIFERGSSPLWSKLRLIGAVSTTPTRLSEQIDKSPFNNARQVPLSDFNQDQLRRLAWIYGLEFSVEDLRQLEHWVRGQPLLANLAMDEAVRRGESLSQLLLDPDRLFGHHLQSLKRQLKAERPELLEALMSIHRDPLCSIDPELLDELRRGGLVDIDGNECRLRCHLYQSLIR
ncbi:MAG: hypothetical protein GY719_23325 [bacterium]|nr:hypothetical protein [bacterium]